MVTTNVCTRVALAVARKGCDNVKEQLDAESSYGTGNLQTEHNLPTGHLQGTFRPRQFKPAQASEGSDLLRSPHPSHPTPPLLPSSFAHSPALEVTRYCMAWRSSDFPPFTGPPSLCFSFSTSYSVLIHWLSLLLIRIWSNA